MKTKFKKGDLILGVLVGRGFGGLYGIVIKTTGKKNGTVFIRWQDNEGIYPHYAGALKLVARAE